MFTEVTPEMILEAYRQGIFPMADTADSSFFHFYRPDQRGLLPIKDLHIPKSLQKSLNKRPYNIRFDTAFSDVIDGCAKTNKTGERDNTWINPLIRDVFIELHEMGYAHSVEAWNFKDELVGGLYGLSIGAVFCGESMFSTATDASKIALVHLCQHLAEKEFTVLDTQFINDHLKQFGAYEMPQEEYETLIQIEMNKNVSF